MLRGWVKAPVGGLLSDWIKGEVLALARGPHLARNPGIVGFELNIGLSLS
jgi:hypothetical protein